MTRQVALLRGINVGRNNQVAMADLRALVEEAGCEDVVTHLRSGNVVLSCDQEPDAVARAIEGKLEARVGKAIRVVVRTADELAAVVEADPFAGVADDPSRYFVCFLSEKPEPAGLRALEEQDFSPDAFSANGRELYVWCPEGLRESRLMRLIDQRPLAATATVRNWRTVTRLLEMVGG